MTEVEGGTLKIYPKSIKKGFNNNSYDLRPTVYKIKSNSKELKELNTVGSGSFIISKPTKVNRMEINMAGSGNVELRGPVKGYKLECNMAGSGNIIAKDIQLDNLSCSLASSGEIEVIGTVDRASFNVAGSGEIKAFDCQARKAECNIASSGEISVYATQILDANIVGSGEIHYKGDPEISKSIMGSGFPFPSIRRSAANPQTAIICMQNIKSDTLVFIVFNFLGSFLNRRASICKGCRNKGLFSNKDQFIPILSKMISPLSFLLKIKRISFSWSMDRLSP